MNDPVVRQEIFSDANTVEQDSALRLTQLQGDFLELAKLTFQLRWKSVEKGPYIGNHMKEMRYFRRFLNVISSLREGCLILHSILDNSIFLKY